MDDGLGLAGDLVSIEPYIENGLGVDAYIYLWIAQLGSVSMSGSVASASLPLRVSLEAQTGEPLSACLTWDAEYSALRLRLSGYYRYRRISCGCRRHRWHFHCCKLQPRGAANREIGYREEC